MRILAALALMSLVAGCVPAAMVVPQSMHAGSTQPRFGALVVAPMTGYGNSLTDKMTGEARSATNEREALIRSLQNSGLFAAVSKDGSAPYLLHAEVTRRDFVGYGATVTVHYLLTETASGSEVCNESFTTSYEGPAVFFAPGAARNGALAHALEENWTALLARLSTIPVTPTAAPHDPCYAP
jgi:hypothetical protein